MSTFNFTVRATDDQGAFADRDFSINVKNDKIVKTILTNGTNAYTTTNPGTDATVIRNGIPAAVMGLSTTTGALTYGNGIWVSGNASSYCTSIDGINWVTQSYPTNLVKSAPITDSTVPNTGKAAGLSVSVVSNISFNNGMFFLQMMVNTAGSVPNRFITYMLCSTDAINWNLFSPNYIGYSDNSSTTSTYYTPGIGSEFVYDGTDIYGFVAQWIGSSSTPTYRFVRSSTSNNVASWKISNITSTAGVGVACSGLAYINGLWIASTPSGNTVYYYTSNDLITWTGRTMPGRGTPLLYSNGVISTIYIMSGNTGSRILTSTDAITWSSATSSTPVGTVYSAVYNGNILTTSSTNIYSYNGVSQTALFATPVSGINGIATTG